jgi:glycosyltransferase involved in cell wall biosynthesis
MINGKKIIVCLPAYNAAITLAATYHDIPFDIVDDVILVDDASTDETLQVAETLGIRHILKHAVNRGYGGNQKTCYEKALQLGADIVIMLHPDYQYNPKLIPSMAYLIANGLFPVVLGSRILGKGALKNGMPLYKYIANRVLTFVQNILLNQKLSEYHTGYRAYAAHVLRAINLGANSDDFVFDNQVLAQIFFNGYEVGEISCPAQYFEDASSINFTRSLTYGCGVLVTSVLYRLAKWNVVRSKLFQNPTLGS